jgi:hypothetical protein
MKRHALLAFCLALAASAAAAATDEPPPHGDREAFAARWEAKGLRPVDSRLDLFYAAGGGSTRGSRAVTIAPVQVSLHEHWQRANRSLERARLRPEEEQALRDEVAKIVAEELAKEFGKYQWGIYEPVLHAYVLDLYLNAPDLQTAVHGKTYTTSFGDMVLVAELRSTNGRIVRASWDHRPAREFAIARPTTRVDNAIEIRAAARGWAKLLAREFLRFPAAQG